MGTKKNIKNKLRVALELGLAYVFAGTGIWFTGTENYKCNIRIRLGFGQKILWKMRIRLNVGLEIGFISHQPESKKTRKQRWPKFLTV